MNRIASLLAAALVAVTLFAGSAGAQSVPRTVSEGLINIERDEIVLFEFDAVQVGATGSCLRRSAAGGSAQVCGNPELTEISWPHKAEVTNIRLFITKVGSSGWDCTFTIRVNGVDAAGATPLVSGPAPALRTVLNQTQPIVVLNEGDLVEVRHVDTGTSPAICNPATPAKLVFHIQGRWIYGTGSASQQN